MAICWKTQHPFLIWNKDKEHSSHLKSVERPTAELEETGLLIEGEELDVDLARRLEDRRRIPDDFAVVVEDRLRHRRHDVVAVRTGTQQNQLMKFSTECVMDLDKLN